jgi:hypothetical protein
LKTLVVIVTLVISTAVFASACDSLPFVALNNPTSTPSRTPRPTFTPRPAATETAVDTDTPSPTAVSTLVPPTETPEAQESSSATPRPVVKATKQPKPPAPAATPKPSFPVSLENTLRCDSSYYTVYVILKRNGNAPRPFVGGYEMILLNTGGQALKNGAGQPLAFETLPDGQQEASVVGNCRRPASTANPLPYNGKIDAGDAVQGGTTSMILRFVKSTTDLTPLSQDFPLDFSTPGEYWFSLGAP